jgi:hypothetical protein
MLHVARLRDYFVFARLRDCAVFCCMLLGFVITLCLQGCSKVALQLHDCAIQILKIHCQCQGIPCNCMQVLFIFVLFRT